MSSEVSASYYLNFIMFVITAVYTIDISLRVEFMKGLNWLCIMIQKMAKTGTNNSKIEKKVTSSIIYAKQDPNKSIQGIRSRQVKVSRYNIFYTLCVLKIEI